MTHFKVAVIMEPDADAEARLEELMAPFNEGIDVEPYYKECGCIGRIARDAAHEAADARFPKIDALRSQYQEWRQTEMAKRGLAPKWQAVLDAAREKKDDPFRDDVDDLMETPEWEAFEKDADAYWERLLAPRKQYEKEQIEAHPLHDKPDPEHGLPTPEALDELLKEYSEVHDIDEPPVDDPAFVEWMLEETGACMGSGKRRTTYNPKSKWDYWTDIGWYDRIRTREEYDADPRRKHEQSRPPYVFAGLIRTTNECLEKKSQPWAIVTPDGEWHEKGKMGWWAMSWDEVEDWPEQVQQIWQQYPEHLVHWLDCHI